MSQPSTYLMALLDAVNSEDPNQVVADGKHCPLISRAHYPTWRY